MPTKTTKQQPSRSWFSAKAENKIGEVMIFDEIGFWGVTAKDFVNAWKAIRGQVNEFNVVINSPGGSVFDAGGMIAVIAQEKKPVTIQIMGNAWSAASWIAMAGDRVVMSDAGTMMIHEPRTETWGTVADHEKTIEALKALSAPMIASYAKKSGKSEDEIAALLNAETWFTAQQAMDAGFVDEVISADPIKASYDVEKFVDRWGLSVPKAMQDAIAVVAIAREPEAPAIERDEMDKPTIESLRRDHPELVQAIATDASAAAVTAERTRIKAIRDAAFDHQGELVDKLIADGTAIAESVIALNKDHKAQGEKVINALEDDTANTVIASIESKPDAKGKTEAEVRAEFKASVKANYLRQGKSEAEAERLADRAARQ